MGEPPRDLEASIRRRLLNHARAVDADPMLVQLWYGLERFLYRLSVSAYRDRFVLKGALLFLVWETDAFRPTRDADMLAFLADDEAVLRAAIVDIARLEVTDDGITFEEASMWRGRSMIQHDPIATVALGALRATNVHTQGRSGDYTGDQMNRKYLYA